jgi:hypothetical protein
MTCSCHKQHDAALDFAKRPTEACIYCAEKHISAAAALARENGYEAMNRTMLIGELVLAQWHLWTLDRPLAEKIRDLRHALQSGEPYDLPALAALVSAEAGKAAEKAAPRPIS